MFRAPFVPLLTKMIRRTALAGEFGGWTQDCCTLVPALDHFATTFVAALHRKVNAQHSQPFVEQSQSVCHIIYMHILDEILSPEAVLKSPPI
jgi:hypothetical protein